LYPRDLRQISIPLLLVAGLFLAGASVIGYYVGIRRVLADVCYRWALALHGQRAWPAANAVYEQAIRLYPREFIHRSGFARALQEQASTTPDESKYDALMRQGEEVLKTGSSLPGYNRHRWHLGHLYLKWAEHRSEPATRKQLAEQAKKSFQEVLEWEPKNPLVWSDVGYVDLTLLQNEAEGIQESQKALEIDPTATEALIRLARFYEQKGSRLDGADVSRENLAKAANYYERAGGTSKTPFALWMTGGNLYMRVNSWNDAARSFALASRVATSMQVVKSEEMLARAYLALTNKTAALEHLQFAISKASETERENLVKLLKQAESTK
jgi:tetratricopeptide (TPR) repeat protein